MAPKRSCGRHAAPAVLARLVGVTLALASLLGGAPSPDMTSLGLAARPAFAQEAPAGGGGEGGEPDGSPEGASHPEDNADAVRKAYLTLLYQEVNVRRGRAASPPFEAMLDAGNEAVNAYLVELTPIMEQHHACFHGSDIMGLRAGWDYLPDQGVTLPVGGEVLACPDVDGGGFWTPPGIADGWWRSPHHFETLYIDIRANAVACGAYNRIAGKNAYETVACITLLPEGQP